MTSEQRPPVEHIEIQPSVDVSVRRSPRYGRFLLLGATVGVVAALLVATFSQPAETELPEQAMTYSLSTVFGFSALVFGSIGALLFGLLALLLDRTVGRRTRPYTAEHEHVAYDEPEDEPVDATASAPVDGTVAAPATAPATAPAQPVDPDVNAQTRA